MGKMKRIVAVGVALLTLQVVAGCATTNAKRLPKHPEEYHVPPEDDPKYSEPIKFPDRVMYKDDPIKSQDAPTDGGRSGLGGGGGGGSSRGSGSTSGM
jgi:uncharacterized membrane protein YgcG